MQLKFEIQRQDLNFMLRLDYKMQKTMGTHAGCSEETLGG